MHPIKKSHLEILLKRFPYYRKLDDKGKKHFLNKLRYFLYSKNFIPRNKMKITPEMKVLISACAAQLTFGLPDIKFSHFNNIIIFPRRFLNTITGHYHSGEVNLHGAIMFSWEDILKGFSDSENGYNVVLHELAHVLKLENIIENDEFRFLKEEYLHNYSHEARFLTDKINSGEVGFLRKYAGTNEDEFFAVAVESFFERPLKFRETLPELYMLLAKLLNQNPAKLEEDYQRAIKQ